MKTLFTTTAIAGAMTLSIVSNANAATKQTVTFESQGQTITGDLYLPDGYQGDAKLPGVIVSGSWTSVKEQMAGGYAAKLADQGYAALAFDFRGWGESNTGTPDSLKFVENPAEKTNDILAAASFMSNLSQVDGRKLATLGICASAGYAIDAAHRSDQITTTATIAPWLHDKSIVDEVYGENIPALLQASKTKNILSAAGETGSGAVMEGPGYYTDPNRGAITAYDNKFSTLSWEPWLNYDAIQTASVITDPVLLVHSDAAAIPQGAKKFAAEGGENVSLVLMDNVTQFDFYDNDADMNAAIAEVDAHFLATFN